jgi:hypothetical protein
LVGWLLVGWLLGWLDVMVCVACLLGWLLVAWLLGWLRGWLWIAAGLLVCMAGVLLE